MSYIYRRFRPETDTRKPFDCGDADLNGFLVETTVHTPNALQYEKEMLAVTYVIEDVENQEILAYFSLLHDKIERTFSDRTIWNRLSRHIPNVKRRSSYPALKIGRLAVCRKAQKTGLGREILSFIKAWYYKHPKAGCRYITVDAYRQAEKFYSNCHFKRLSETLPEEETVLMYYDLKVIR